MVLVGISDGAKFTTVMSVIVETTPKEAVGLASGLVLSMGYVGAMIGTLVGGRILDLTGSLNQAFIVLAGVAAATIVVTFLLPEIGPMAKRQKHLRYGVVESKEG